MRSERLFSVPWNYNHDQLLKVVEQDAGFKFFCHPPTYDLSNQEKRIQFIDKKLQLQSTYGFCKQPVFTIQNSAFIGLIGLEPFTFEGKNYFELGFRLLKPFWKLGYASEFSKVLIENFLTKYSNQMIGCLVHVENKASDTTVRKLGFKPVKEFAHNGELHIWYEFFGQFNRT